MKRYIKPHTILHHAECMQMMAVSIIDGKPANDSEVMTKEYNDWDIWEN